MDMLDSDKIDFLKTLIRETLKEELSSMLNLYLTKEGKNMFAPASKLPIEETISPVTEEPAMLVINQMFKKGWADMPDSPSYADKKNLLTNSFKRLDFAFACQMISDMAERKSVSSTGKAFGFFFAKASLFDKSIFVLKIPGDSFGNQPVPFANGDYLTIEYYKKGIYNYTSKQNVSFEEKEIWAFANKIEKA